MIDLEKTVGTEAHGASDPAYDIRRRSAPDAIVKQTKMPDFGENRDPGRPKTQLP